MRKLRQALMTAAVLAAVWTIGATLPHPGSVRATEVESATLAGGCFWGLQETLRQIPGVIQTTVGYTGGTTLNPTYELVAGGKTGHVEAVEVMFDPTRLSYEALLADFLAARNHGRGSAANPHPSTIFYHGAAQRQSAERVKDAIKRSGLWDSPVVAEIKPATRFYPAEEYHQDYYQKAAARRCGLE